MIRITDKNRVPKNGYTFTVPETSRPFSAHIFSRLAIKVREYQAANGYHISTVEEIEEDYCKRHPEQCNDGVSKHTPTVEHDDLLTRIAASVGIPAADALSKLSAKLGINCATCNKRNQIIKKVRQLGFTEALRQLKETL